MTIVGGLDLHRGQITYDWADASTGEVSTGRVAPATREALRAFLGDLGTSDAEFVVEGCTGWLFVAEELARAGMVAHVADPAEAAALRGRKKRAKTDRADARHLRQLLADGRVPESWIPPPHMANIRALGRLYLDLVQARNAWAQRIHATLFHQGAPRAAYDLSVAANLERAVASAEDFPSWFRHAVAVAASLIEFISELVDGIRRELQWVGRNQPGARALQTVYGIGALTGALIWVEMGDVRRFANASQAVRHAGLDVTVHDSDGKRRRGRLSRQGPGMLRWALYETALSATRPASPDHARYRKLADRLNHTTATLSIARLNARRSYHILKELGDQALDPPTSTRRRTPLALPA